MHQHHHGHRDDFGPSLGRALARAGVNPAVMAQLRQRMRRGDVRASILRLLAEEPMHGYQILQELGERSGGTWRPSPGSVYPTLQLLADEGLVVAEEDNGRRVYRLTEAGSAEAARIAEQPAPWDESTDDAMRTVAHLHKALARLANATMQVSGSGSAAQITAATEVLAEARRKLYAILAED